MAEQTTVDLDELETAVPFGTVAIMFLSVLFGVLLAVVLVPAWAPDLAATLFGDAPKAYWYLSRASGLTAYGLMWLSMALGISISNKLARLWPGGPLAFELHQYLSLLGLNLALFHALILLGDRYIQYSLSQVLVPFQSTAYEPLWVGLGQLAFYALIVISLSFYVRKRIGHKLWRWLHFLTFGAFAMALLHGITSGSDSSSLLVQAAYVASGASLLFLSIYRVVGAIFPVQTSKRSARG